MKSSTSAGSSIQQTKPESSTLSKPKTLEQTLESYIHEHVQKQIPEMTWNQVLRSGQTIASLMPPTKDMLTIDQINLANKQPEKITLHTGKKTLTTTAPTSQALVVQPIKTKLDTPFYPQTNRVQDIIQIEPEVWHSNPNQVALNIFPSGFHFRATDLRKTRSFYELILVHSQSVEIKRETEPNGDEPLFSKLQIKNVLTPAKWGQDLNKLKYFGEQFDKICFEPRGYTYWDYVDAWSNVFWDQNKSYKHTWFIFFKTKTEYNFPQWFVHWWNFFGPAPEILPPQIMQAFEHFKQKFNIGEDPFPINLHYFSKLSAAWIFSWQYRFSPTPQGSKFLPILQRLPYVRWWAKFDLRRIDIKAVDSWFKANPQHLCMSEQSKFLNQKARVQSLLASTTDKTALINQLNAMLQVLQQQDQTSSSDQTLSTPASEDPEEDEDKDFTVDLAED